VRRIIPIAARALGREFATLFDRYVHDSAPRGSKADLDEAAAFVEAIRPRAHHLQAEWAVDLAVYELAWRQAALAGRTPIVRMFRFPVARVAAGHEPELVVPRATLACWWRPTRRGRIRHVVITLPWRGFRRG
jgi:hypothetical protein